MYLNAHSELVGRHAFLSASKYHWINYDDEKMRKSFLTELAARRGTELHEFAAHAIKLGIQLAETTKTINQYINDAIGFRMTPEQVLFVSNNAFGTADALSYRRDPKTNRHMLRIHDLKTGVTPASFEQLQIYTAFFCLEYKINPRDIDIELRIYQSDEVLVLIPELNDIQYIISQIIHFDKLIDTMRAEVY